MTTEVQAKSTNVQSFSERTGVLVSSRVQAADYDTIDSASVRGANPSSWYFFCAAADLDGVMSCSLTHLSDLLDYGLVLDARPKEPLGRSV